MKPFFQSTLVLSILAAGVFAYNALAAQTNSYKLHALVANKAKYNADKVDAKLVNAWGIAIRPAGAGGHFWVTGGNISFEYVGDVRASNDKKMHTLHTHGVEYVKLPVGGKDNTATGVVYLDSRDKFVITQHMPGKELITAPAKFLFASDGGIVSAWTERKRADGTFDWPEDAVTVIDESASGVQFFGFAANSTFDTLYGADFGKNPDIRVYGSDFKPKAVTFDRPFDGNRNGKVDPGEYAPFNIQLVTDRDGKHHLLVAYARTRACPEEEVARGTCKEGEIFAGEEDTEQTGNGRLAEFTEDGKLVAVWKDGGRLNAPWGLAYAPNNFGAFSGALLVSNFGDGTIAAYDPKTHEFMGYMKGKDGKNIVIDKIWGLTFGNGVSLGDRNALYFAAGPDDEADGLFGSLRPVR